jgi:hemolysin III
VTPEKPRLRGVFHQWACFAAIAAGIAYVAAADGERARLAVGVFAVSVVTMFGASALYHRVNWSPSRRRWMRRLDHAMIYGLIAGSYTPFGLLALHGNWRTVVLGIVWSGAAVAILLKLVWVDSPKWLSAVTALVLGWVGIVAFPKLVAPIGVLGAVLVAVGGVFYTLGAIVYARRRPDPRPHVFGYHELFHALVVAAVACQYAAVGMLAL